MCAFVEDVRTLSSSDDFNARIERMKKVIEMAEAQMEERKAA
jgi:hypothetical protein